MPERLPGAASIVRPRARTGHSRPSGPAGVPPRPRRGVADDGARTPSQQALDGKGNEQNTPKLFEIKEPRNRATKMVNFLGNVIVNGNEDVKFTDPNKKLVTPKIPKFEHKDGYPKGTKDLLTEKGPEEFAKWLKAEKKIHFTDTTLRDAHQSLLATRMRTFDMMKVAEGFAKNHPEVFSMEVWGGATFDVCMRFLKENAVPQSLRGSGTKPRYLDTKHEVVFDLDQNGWRVFNHNRIVESPTFTRQEVTING